MVIHQDTFFVTDSSSSFCSTPSRGDLRRDFLEQATRNPLPNVPDLELAEALVHLAHTELAAFGTSGSQRITEDPDIQLVLRACAACCGRVGIDFPELPFRHFSSFRKFWIGAGMSGSYAARRTYLESVFDPIAEDLSRLAIRSWADGLAQAVSPHSGTGWASVDAEIRELRRRFEFARTGQDHCAVGTACVRILEHLADVVFDPSIHVPSGEVPPARDKTKARLDLVISYYASGPDNELMRKLARSVIEVAQQVKHRATPTRCDAGIASDSVILLANMLRRLSTR